VKTLSDEAARTRLLAVRDALLTLGLPPDSEIVEALNLGSERLGVCDCATGAHIAQIRTDIIYCPDCGGRVPHER
jgi:hypothetical protein